MEIAEAPFSEIHSRAAASLAKIAEHLAKGKIVPETPLRVCGTDPPMESARTVRLGVYPVTGNPLHWGHLLAALDVIAKLALDRLAFVIQGVDQRKQLASATTEANRHAMAQQVLELLDPLAVYSDVGKGNSYIGEENIFRLLQLNPRTRIVAYYMVGSDHYRLTDARGRPDTLPRLQCNMYDPIYRFDTSLHQIRVVFVRRGQLGRKVQTPLDVQFVPAVIKSSSTEVRHGNLSLAPHEVRRYLRCHRDYAQSIGLTVLR